MFSSVLHIVQRLLHSLRNIMAPTSERVFADLIAHATHKYPNWDPEIPIMPGDYGRITGGQRGPLDTLLNGRMGRRRRPSRSGTFLKEGNIFTEGLAEKYNIPPPVEYGAESTQGTTWITSRNAEQVTWNADIAGQHPGLAECSIKASFRFTTGQGAVLAMDNDTVLAIDPPAKLLRLLSDKALPEDTVIVSEVHRCSSYARFLSSSYNQNTSVTLGLKVQPLPVPLPGPAGSSSSPSFNNQQDMNDNMGQMVPGWANVEGKWVHDSTAGNFRAKVNKDGKRVFYPLFRLVSLDEESLSTGLRR